MSDINTLDTLLTRLEKNVDRAKADPGAFLDDLESMKSTFADFLELDLMTCELNSRIALIFADLLSMAKGLNAAANTKKMVYDVDLLKLLNLLANKLTPDKKRKD